MSSWPPSDSPHRLSYRETHRVVLRDDTYRWVDLSSFEIKHSRTDFSARSVLSWLLSDEHNYINRYNVADNSPTHRARSQQDAEAKALWLADIASHPHVSMPPRLEEHLRGSYVPYDGPAVHGPYWMSALSADVFDELNGAAANRALNDWLNDDGYPEPHEVDGDLTAVLDHLLRSPTVFKLRELGDQAEHDTGWVVQPFIELVAVDLHSHTLALVAGGGD